MAAKRATRSWPSWRKRASSVLTLHLLIVVSMLGGIWRAFRASVDPNVRALTAIVTGALLGALVIGIFEAWWVAPGAPESLWFWTMVGWRWV
jgi:hypothetical protein